MQARSENQPHQWIDCEQALAEACGHLAQSDLMGLDIEFVRSDTYYPRAALYQLASRSRLFLIDPLAIHNLAPLTELLVSERILKVVHGASEDLEVIRTHLHVTPRNLFDTQLAASVVHLGWSLGYSSLVNTLLQVQLSKQEQCSDWLARPLSEAQIRYALQDVSYLVHLHEELDDRMTKMHRRSWFDEELPQWVRRDEVLPESSYLRISGLRRLLPRQRAVLRALCAWRETEAQRQDRPRQWLVRDEHLLRIAARDRIDSASLLEDAPRKTAQRYGPALIRAFARGKSSELPPDLEPALTGESRSLVKSILAEVARLAPVIGVPQELLGRRREIERSVREWRVNSAPPRYLDGWRAPFLVPLFEQKLGSRRVDST